MIIDPQPEDTIQAVITALIKHVRELEQKIDALDAKVYHLANRNRRAR